MHGVCRKRRRLRDGCSLCERAAVGIADRAGVGTCAQCARCCPGATGWCPGISVAPGAARRRYRCRSVAHAVTGNIRMHGVCSKNRRLRNADRFCNAAAGAVGDGAGICSRTKSGSCCAAAARRCPCVSICSRSAAGRNCSRSVTNAVTANIGLCCCCRYCSRLRNGCCLRDAAAGSAGDGAGVSCGAKPACRCTCSAGWRPGIRICPGSARSGYRCSAIAGAVAAYIGLCCCCGDRRRLRDRYCFGDAAARSAGDGAGVCCGAKTTGRCSCSPGWCPGVGVCSRSA